MPAWEHKNKTIDFPTLPGPGVWRHAFLVAAFSFLVVGQLMFLLGGRAQILGNGFWLCAILLAAVLVCFCYLNLYLLVPRLLLNNKYVEYLMALFGIITVYIAIKWTVERYLLSQLGVDREFNAMTLLDWLSNIFMYAIALMSTSAVVLFRQWIADTQKINYLENNSLQDSVDEIKSRIDAPVLYRVLGYAADKVKTNPEKASAIIFKLGERLRRELYENEKRNGSIEQ